MSIATMLGGGMFDPSHWRSFNFTDHIATYDGGTEKLSRCITGPNPRFEPLLVHLLDNTLVGILKCFRRKWRRLLIIYHISA